MLTADQVKPFLLDEDYPVRNIVVDYFEESWSQDVDLLPLILQAIERYGEAHGLSLAAHAHRFPLTEESLDQGLERLTRTSDRNLSHHLNEILLRAPVPLLQSREGALRNHPQLDPQVLTLWEQRREWATWSAERLWEELQDFSRRSEEHKYVGEIDHDYAEALVEAVGERDVPDTETICQLLRSPEVDGSWLETFLVDLAGARRAVAAIPAVYDKLLLDADYLNEQAMRALARIGDPEVARVIRAGWPTTPEHARGFVASVPGKIKHPESVDAILAMMEVDQEDDLYPRTCLCKGLCDLFSERGLEAVKRQIAEGYDSFFLDLEEYYLVARVVLVHDDPEVAAWRAQRPQREKKWADIRRRSEALLVEPPPSREVPAPPPRLAPEPVWRSPSQVPFVRTQPKVGRNEPCPCGSGKKFKNCCLRKQ